MTSQRETDRETTRKMLDHYRELLTQEPPQDAGGHPSLPVHEQQGARWADWDRQCRAWRTLLYPRLLAEALSEVSR